MPSISCPMPSSAPRRGLSFLPSGGILVRSSLTPVFVGIDKAALFGFAGARLLVVVAFAAFGGAAGAASVLSSAFAFFVRDGFAVAAGFPVVVVLVRLVVAIRESLPARPETRGRFSGVES